MPSTMTLSYLVFPSGTPVPGTEPPVPISVPDGSPQTLSAWDQLTVAAPPGDPSSYTFAFWAVPSLVQATQFTNGVPDSQQVISFPGPSDESFNATAWYVPDGGDGPPLRWRGRSR